MELGTSNRLMPPRRDRLALATQAEAVAKWLRPQYAKGRFGEPAVVVFVEKNRRGVRPISEMTLPDRVLYRALVALIAESLPTNLTERLPIGDFHAAPLGDPNVRYVSKSDVAAYYEFIDHELLEVELLSQTGEAPAIQALLELLGKVMGRRVGLPQIHKSSDILGDVYIDPVRRRLRRAGYDAYTYSDDFRIGSHTLAAARAALETCATEVRSLGLVLNESKTYTYGVDKYRASLTAFSEAQRRLFNDDSDEMALLLEDDYEDADQQPESTDLTLGPEGEGGTHEEDALFAGLESSETGVPEVNEAQATAARRAWALWFTDGVQDEGLSNQDAAITQSLVSRALPILGEAGDEDPINDLSSLLRHEPALTPRVARYLINLGMTRAASRTRARRILDELAGEESFSLWQQMWLAEAAGGIRALHKRGCSRGVVSRGRDLCARPLGYLISAPAKAASSWQNDRGSAVRRRAAVSPAPTLTDRSVAASSANACSSVVSSPA